MENQRWKVNKGSTKDLINWNTNYYIILCAKGKDPARSRKRSITSMHAVKQNTETVKTKMTYNNVKMLNIKLSMYVL